MLTAVHKPQAHSIISTFTFTFRFNHVKSLLHFHFHTVKIVFMSQFLLARCLALYQPYFLVPLFPLFSPLSSSPLPPPPGKISYRISLPPVSQCISQIHLELDYLPECTHRDPVMKQGRREGEEEGKGRRERRKKGGRRGRREGGGGGRERGREGKRERRREGGEERGREGRRKGGGREYEVRSFIFWDMNS